ncbi:MAG: 30S ribosomal protein S19e [Candidatus Hodarchaeales archaeon]
MVSVYTVPANLLITRLAKEFKEKDLINPPEWNEYVKTCHFKENIPGNSDWFFVRSASVLRKIYAKGPIGIQELRKIYGSKKNKGSSPNHASRASGAVLRNIVQQLERNGFVELIESQGRKMTPKGMSFVDAISKELKSEIPELERYF